MYAVVVSTVMPSTGKATHRQTLYGDEAAETWRCWNLPAQQRREFFADCERVDGFATEAELLAWWERLANRVCAN